jgi:hypothetical protein
MRKMMLALTAASLTIPAVPTVAVAHDNQYYNGKVWRDSQGRLRCKRPNGTTAAPSSAGPLTPAASAPRAPSSAPRPAPSSAASSIAAG